MFILHHCYRRARGAVVEFSASSSRLAVSLSQATGAGADRRNGLLSAIQITSNHATDSKRRRGRHNNEGHATPPNGDAQLSAIGFLITPRTMLLHQRIKPRSKRSDSCRHLGGVASSTRIAPLKTANLDGEAGRSPESCTERSQRES